MSDDYVTVVDHDGKIYAAPRGTPSQPVNSHNHGVVQNDDYVFLPAANGSYNAVRRAEQHLNLQQMVEKKVGTWMLVSDREAFRVWDGEKWLEFPKLLPVRMGILPHNMTERFNADEIEHMTEMYAEMTDEEERMALRRLLAEAQADGQE